MSTPYVEQEAWAQVVFGVGVATFVIGELTQALRWRRGASRADLRGEVAFRVAFFAGILVLPLAKSLAPAALLEGPWTFVLGAVVGWLGLLLRWWSFVTIGKYFTTVIKTSADQPVISAGPYRVVRHPSYSGLLAAFLGCGLMLGNWAGTTASFFVILAAVIYRIQREERAMIVATGDRYADYTRQRARLVPFVW